MSGRLSFLIVRGIQVLTWHQRLAALFANRPDLRGVNARADVVDELARWSA